MTRLQSRTLSLFAFVLAYVLPLVMINVYYYDDLFRAYLGYVGWDTDGRPFASWFYAIVTFGQTLPDIYPLPLVLSLAIFSYAGVVYAKENRIQYGVSFALAYSMLLLNPLFLSNLLFRYDSAFMVLAATLCVLPFSLPLRHAYSRYAAGGLCLILAFGMYQAAVGVFIALAGLELVATTKRGGLLSALKRCAMRVAQLAASYLAYSLLLSFYDINSGFSSFSRPVPLSIEGLRTISLNVEAASVTLRLLFNQGLLLALAPISVVVVLCYAKYVKDTGRWSVILSAALAGVAACIAIPGIALFGQTPLFFPRVYIGLGAVFMMAAVMPLIFRSNGRVTTTAIGILAFYFFGFMCATANAVREDIEFQKQSAARIISAIDDHGLSGAKSIAILGDLRKSPTSITNIRSYPAIEALTPAHFANEYDGGRFILMHMGLNRMEYIKADGALRAKVDAAEPVFSNNLFSLFNIDGTPVLSFERTIFDGLNVEPNRWPVTDSPLSHTFLSENHFYTCIPKSMRPDLGRNEWYYLLLKMKGGEVLNRSFSVPYSISKQDRSCVVHQWSDGVSADEVILIEFGIYSIETGRRRIEFQL